MCYMVRAAFLKAWRVGKVRTDGGSSFQYLVPSVVRNLGCARGTYRFSDILGLVQFVWLIELIVSVG